MKPSDLLNGPQEAAWELPYPRSEADPPISAAEARAADTAVCRWHNGLITHSRTATDTYGRVYFCPVGRSYWRLTEREAGMYGELPYEYAGAI
jgi:hypothetical protein